MANRKEIISKARSWIGIEFRFRGRSRGGIDCSGLIISVGNDLKLTQYDFLHYQLNEPDPIGEHFEKAGIFEIPKEEMLPGDILNIAIRERAIHLAILANDVKMIHTNQTVNQVVECHLPHKRERIVRVFRYPNIEEI